MQMVRRSTLELSLLSIKSQFEQARAKYSILEKHGAGIRRHVHCMTMLCQWFFSSIAGGRITAAGRSVNCCLAARPA